jgi:hypothetical protein
VNGVLPLHQDYVRKSAEQSLFSVEHDVNAKTHPLYVQRLDMQGVNNTKGGIRLRPHKRMIGGVNRLNEPHT